MRKGVLKLKNITYFKIREPKELAKNLTEMFGVKAKALNGHAVIVYEPLVPQEFACTAYVKMYRENI